MMKEKTYQMIMDYIIRTDNIIAEKDAIINVFVEHFQKKFEM